MPPTPRTAVEPRVDRPRIPAAYGTGAATEHVAWSDVEERLTAATVYWIATVSAEGRPRVRPVDGVYVDGAVYVGGSPETRWVQDIAGNTNVAIHLDGADHVVILEGEAERLTSMDRRRAERLAEASNAKFPQYNQTPEVYEASGAIAIVPRKVVAWSDISRDPTRFRFAR
jgi:general stress protein 26